MIGLPNFLIVETAAFARLLLLFFGIGILSSLLAWKYPHLIPLKKLSAHLVQGLALGFLTVSFINQTATCQCPYGATLEGFGQKQPVLSYNYSYTPIRILGFQEIKPPPRIISNCFGGPPNPEIIALNLTYR